MVIIKRYWGTAGVLLLTLCLLLCNILLINLEQVDTFGRTFTPRTTLILDAGHGGEDGGAVTADSGLAESHINLSIVLKMNDILELYGITPVLLRTEDRSLHDEQAITLREKKASDLKNRVAAINAIPNATLISIHQNSFTQSCYRGTQTFFAPTEGSKELAEQIQTAICATIQQDNTRCAKSIPDSVYLMNHIYCPAVLVECGFLSNPAEAAALQTDQYQTKVAAILTAVWLSAEQPTKHA